MLLHGCIYPIARIESLQLNIKFNYQITRAQTRILQIGAGVVKIFNIFVWIEIGFFRYQGSIFDVRCIISYSHEQLVTTTIISIIKLYVSYLINHSLISMIAIVVWHSTHSIPTCSFSSDMIAWLSCYVYLSSRCVIFCSHEQGLNTIQWWLSSKCNFIPHKSFININDGHHSIAFYS